MVRHGQTDVTRAMRIAAVDLVFSWPPLGGADVDLFHVLSGLRELGHEVHLFGLSDGASWDRGAFAPEELPFPATRFEYTEKTFRRETVVNDIRDAVRAFAPEVILVADGFFLKPYMMLALAEIAPVVARYYAHEAVCHKDLTRFKNGAPCPLSYLDTPDACRRCALGYLGPALRGGTMLAWHRDYLAAEAYRPEYHAVVCEALSKVAAAVVYNEGIKKSLAGHCANVRVIPGGANLNSGTDYVSPVGNGHSPLVVAMAGRAEDPLKGWAALEVAAMKMWETRQDFQVRVTLPPDTVLPPWGEAVGWLSREEMAVFYRDAAICVVPSVWEEPFGMVAVEAMAAMRPVVASRSGGLAEIVVDGETGALFPAGDAGALAGCIARLLDDAALRERMGRAGRERMEALYGWDRVVQEEYEVMLRKAVTSGRAGAESIAFQE